MEYKFHPMGNPINLTKETIVGWSDRASKAEEPQPGNSDPAGGIWSAGLSIHCQETSCTSCYEGRVARWKPFLSRIPKQLPADYCALSFVVLTETGSGSTGQQ